jgi:hypothetical protein
MKKSVWILPLALGAMACSKGPDNASEPTAVESASDSVGGAAHDAALEAGDQPPGIDPNVAPGVAFDYRFDYSLPEKRIAELQEQHSRLCGRLGLAHCRVTGLTFNKARNGNIDADMSFKLDPAMALTFTRDATDLINRAEGKLETSNVEGNNVGDSIVSDDKSADAKRAELAKIEAEIKIPGLSKTRRDELSRQAAELRDALDRFKADRDEKVESLATTPVVFNYEPNETIMGFDRSSPVQQGLSVGSMSFSTMFSFIALALGVLVPWSLVGFGIWWVVRRVRARRSAAAVVVD